MEPSEPTKPKVKSIVAAGRFSSEEVKENVKAVGWFSREDLLYERIRKNLRTIKNMGNQINITEIPIPGEQETYMYKIY